MSTTTTFTSKLACLVVLSAGLAIAEDDYTPPWQKDQQEKGAFGVAGKMVDVTNDKSVQTAVTAYDTKKEIEGVQTVVQTYKAGNAAQNASPTGLALSAAKDQMFKYRSSVVGVTRMIDGAAKTVQKVLDNISDRVNRWRTTLPMLRSYAQSAGDFVENSAEYLSSFEVSDLWDLDQKFFRGLEDRVKYGYGLGMSFFYYILNRKDGFGQFAGMFDAFYQPMELPYKYIYNYYSLPTPDIKDLNNEDRVGMVAIFEAQVGIERLNRLSDGEYVCDAADPELDCSCPEGSTCKPSTRRELTMKKIVDGFNNVRITTEDLDKIMERLQARRLEVASKRKVIQEIRARMAMRKNEALSYRAAMEAASQQAACLGSKAMFFDSDHLTSPKYLPNTCDDVATFKGTQMNLVAPLSMRVF